MNIERLQMIIKTNDTARECFIHWNERLRDTKQVKFIRFKKTLMNHATSIDDKAMRRLFEILKEEGAGDFLVRDGKEYAFLWKTEIKKLASDVMGKPVLKETRERVKLHVVPKPVHELVLAVPMTSGEIIRIGLRSDISKKDLENISKALMSL